MQTLSAINFHSFFFQLDIDSDYLYLGKNLSFVKAWKSLYEEGVAALRRKPRAQHLQLQEAIDTRESEEETHVVVFLFSFFFLFQAYAAMFSS